MSLGSKILSAVQAAVETIPWDANLAALVGVSDYIETWQDRELKFDTIPAHVTTCRPGEEIFDTLDRVEDTKGNNGEEGVLSCTALRIIWISSKTKFTNLSIGYNCINQISTRQVFSRVRNSNTQALAIIAMQNHSKYEFLFTSANPEGSARMFETVQGFYRAYCTTRPYREVRVRGAIIKNTELDLLPSEVVYERLDGVWNLASEQGVLGRLTVTNVRCAWHSLSNDAFNVSTPYLQIISIRSQDSKYGNALVIETNKRSGELLLGFRVDPPEVLQSTTNQLRKLWSTFQKSPVFGVEYAFEEGTAVKHGEASGGTHYPTEGDFEFITNDTDTQIHRSIGGSKRYIADGVGGYVLEGAECTDGDVDAEGGVAVMEIILDPHLGLAMGVVRDAHGKLPVPDGASVAQQLWRF